MAFIKWKKKNEVFRHSHSSRTTVLQTSSSKINMINREESTLPPILNSSVRSWNCPWISPHIVTGLLTGCNITPKTKKRSLWTYLNRTTIIIIKREGRKHVLTPFTKIPHQLFHPVKCKYLFSWRVHVSDTHMNLWFRMTKGIGEEWRTIFCVPYESLIDSDTTAYHPRI